MATTKLNTSIREAFIRSVMDDVPHVDYVALIKNLIEEALPSCVPAEIKAVLANPDLRVYLRRKEVYTRELCGYGTIPITALPSSWVTDDTYYPNLRVSALPDDAPFRLRSQVQEWGRLCKQQSETRDSLRTRLKQVAYGCTTLKQLKEALPEFNDPKYLPPEFAPTARAALPALANLSADFIRAGWPKDKPRAAVKADADAKTGAGVLTPDPAVVAAKARKAAAKKARGAA